MKDLIPREYEASVINGRQAYTHIITRRIFWGTKEMIKDHNKRRRSMKYQLTDKGLEVVKCVECGKPVDRDGVTCVACRTNAITKKSEAIKRMTTLIGVAEKRYLSITPIDVILQHLTEKEAREYNHMRKELKDLSGI